MMLKKISLALVAAVGFSTMATAQQTELDTLLNKVREGTSTQSQKHKEREARFRANQNERQALLAQAREEKVRLEREAERLERLIRDNDAKIAELQKRQADRLGVLQELFGVLQQSASDAKGTITTSFVTYSQPNRLERLDTLVQKSADGGSVLPTVEEINELPAQLLAEMVGSSQVINFEADVVLLDGTKERMTVTRIGDFGLVANGGFIRVSAETGELADLARQPADRFTSTVASYQTGGGAILPIGIDPTRGQLLSLEVEKATPMERIQQGGTVGYLILALGGVGVLLAVLQWFYLLMVGAKVRGQIKDRTPNTGNPLGRILAVYDNNKTVDVETLELKLDEAILKETPAIERFLTIVKLISAVAPLFGLLGTVIGMIETFQSITLFGTGDPKIMAGGISTALMTTVLGLVVAIPTLLLHTFVAGSSKSVIHILEEQSAGIIAVHAEEEHAKNA